MPRLIGSLMVVVLSAGPPAGAAPEGPSDPLTLDSPDGRLRVAFRLGTRGDPGFEVAYDGRTVASGALGLEFADSGPLRDGLRVVGVRRRDRDRSYAIPVGKASSARDHHRELIVSVEEGEAPSRGFDLAFRAFDDGVAFRYRITDVGPNPEFVLVDEQTRLSFPDDPPARVLPLNGYTTPYEAYYETLRVSEIGPGRLIGLPLLLERSSDGSGSAWVAVTEANLIDYAGMYLSGDDDRPGTLAVKLSPLPGRDDRAKVVGRAPHRSPWRVLMVADDPGRLIESHLVFHLSDPTAIADPSWIRPGQTTFPWWNGYVLDGVDFEPGVNTATMRHYIDFCAEQGIPYHSLDGLDIAWYGGPIRPDGPTDVTTAAPSIDLPAVLGHAEERGVRLRLWMHWRALRPQIDEAFATFERWGIEGVMVDFMDRDDQEMIRFYHEMAEKAAKHHLTITFHGAYKPTGMERTWPNVLSYEAVLNQEYNKWQPSGVRGTPPGHNLDVAFVRMLAGPLDYHQGGMRSVLPEDYRFRDKAPPVQGTRGHQLAMYVVYQNHLPMLADSPDAYRGLPELAFLTGIPSTWDETRVLLAEPGRCLVIARRAGDAWYLGGMTADRPRELDLPLDFLGDVAYRMEAYQDDEGGGPTAVTPLRRAVSATEPLRVAIPRAGGFVARLDPMAP